MKTLIILAMLLQVDDRKVERDRMEMLKRVGGGVGTVETEREDVYGLRNLARGGYSFTARADFDQVIPFQIEDAKSAAVMARAMARFLKSPAPSRPLPGFFLDDKGTFLTTTEGLSGSKHNIRLPDGRTLKADVITNESKVGLAVLQVKDAKSVKPLSLGDSSKLEPGRTVLVATFAGTSPVLRQAVVIDRDPTALDTYSVEDFLHIDYPATPDEVGSPVLDLDGNVIGILAKPVFEKVEEVDLPRRAYVIPAATIAAFLAKRDAQGKFEIGFVGVALEKSPYGGEITYVASGSAAEKAGLQVGDVITTLEGKTVQDFDDLRRLVCFRARETVDFTIRRKEETLTVKVTVGVREEPKPTPSPAEVLREKTGLTLMDLSEDLRKFLGVEKDKGVVVAEVASGSAAEQAGLQKGDVIASVDNGAVDSSEQMTEKIAKIQKDAYVVLETYRSGKRVPVVIKVR
ncbi:MAG: PDZ domain-containing protein [Planctomycetes bacterium]|nr:PDZ domain-containing protein [Planctomycetota bacterium]